MRSMSAKLCRRISAAAYYQYKYFEEMTDTQSKYVLKLRRKATNIGHLGPLFNKAGFEIYRRVSVPSNHLDHKISKQGHKERKDAVEGKETQSAYDEELSNAAVRIQAQVRRRMSQRKHRERIDAHMTSKKMSTSESEYRGNGHQNVSVANDEASNEEIKAPVSTDYSPKPKIYDRSWNVPASEIRNYRNFLKQYIAKNAGGEGFEPFSERGLTKWGINARDSTFELLRKVLLVKFIQQLWINPMV